ncbi:hypothetical protein CYY_010130, partial [Polysphondylium violaceum]
IDKNKGVYVENLKQEPIDSNQLAMDLLKQGISNRHTESTSFNETSSRSHSILTLNLESKNKSNKKILYSKLNIVDLAGSERQKNNNNENNNSRIKDASFINKSLSTLGNVIRNLVDISNGKPRHVPYRDSKLTLLLKEALGGNSKAYIIATISTLDHCFSETLSTCQFSQRAKSIQNTPTINHKQDEKQDEKKQQQQQQQQQQEQESIYNLKVQLVNSLEREEILKKENNKLLEKIDFIQDSNEKKDQYISNMKSILKYRDQDIYRLSCSSPSLNIINNNNNINSLKETKSFQELKLENEILYQQILYQPDLNILLQENRELLDIIKEYQEFFNDNQDQDQDPFNYFQSLKQQNKELVSTINNLMQDNNNNNNNLILNSEMIKVELKIKIIENEKKEMESQQQLLKKELISSESTVQVLEKQLKHLENKCDLLIKEQSTRKTIQDSIVTDTLDSAFKQFKKNNKNPKNYNQEYIESLEFRILLAEQENQLLSKSNDSYLNQLFENTKKLNDLYLLLEAFNLSNQKMSSFFISSPLKLQESTNVIDKDEIIKQLKYQFNEKNENLSNRLTNYNFQDVLQLTSKIHQLENQLKEKDKELQIAKENYQYSIKKSQLEYQDEMEKKLNLLLQKVKLENLSVIENLKKDLQSKNTIYNQYLSINDTLKKDKKEQENEIKYLRNQFETLNNALLVKSREIGKLNDQVGLYRKRYPKIDSDIIIISSDDDNGDREIIDLSSDSDLEIDLSKLTIKQEKDDNQKFNLTGQELIDYIKIKQEKLNK